MQERFVHFMFFEEIASRYRSLNSVFSVIEFCFSSDYPSMWFEVRRFNCCPTFVQIISNGTEKGFSLFPSILIIRLLLSPSCDCVKDVRRMYYSSRKLYLAKSQIVTVRPELQSCQNAFTLYLNVLEDKIVLL